MLQLDVCISSVETQNNGIVFIYNMNNSKYANFDYELSQKILVLLKGENAIGTNRSEQRKPDDYLPFRSAIDWRNSNLLLFAPPLCCRRLPGQTEEGSNRNATPVV